MDRNTHLLAVDHAIFLSPLFLLAFFVLLIGASLASYRWFEAPAQRWMRARLRTNKKSPLHHQMKRALVDE